MSGWHDGEVTSPLQTATATLHTNRGDIVISLFGNHAPKTVENFVGLAQGTKEYKTQNAKGETSGPFYDGAVFHRVIDGFMIQGGDPTGTGRGGPGYRFDDEVKNNPHEHQVGSLSMANAGPNTNGSQFFIITGDQGTQLPPNYTLFGQVTEGMDTTVAAMAAAANPDASANGVPPTEPITITKVTVSAS